MIGYCPWCSGRSDTVWCDALFCLPPTGCPIGKPESWKAPERLPSPDDDVPLAEVIPLRRGVWWRYMRGKR